MPNPNDTQSLVNNVIYICKIVQIFSTNLAFAFGLWRRFSDFPDLVIKELIVQSHMWMIQNEFQFKCVCFASFIATTGDWADISGIANVAALETYLTTAMKPFNNKTLTGCISDLEKNLTKYQYTPYDTNDNISAKVPLCFPTT